MRSRVLRQAAALDTRVGMDGGHDTAGVRGPPIRGGYGARRLSRDTAAAEAGPRRLV